MKLFTVAQFEMMQKFDDESGSNHTLNMHRAEVTAGDENIGLDEVKTGNSEIENDCKYDIAELRKIDDLDLISDIRDLIGAVQMVRNVEAL
jgi:hypothetical protein